MVAKKRKSFQKITIRTKQISKGRHSIYLDFYPPILDSKTGKTTRREFLGKHLIDDPQTDEQTEDNEKMMNFARIIKNNRQNEFDKTKLYTAIEREQVERIDKEKQRVEMDFLAYFKTISDEMNAQKNNKTWYTCYKSLSEYSGGKLTFGEVTPEFARGFKKYLLTKIDPLTKEPKLVQNSASAYFSKFKAALNRARKENLFMESFKDVEPIRMLETQRNFLSMEEVNTLYKTNCQSNIVKNAAMFMILTGVRVSDVRKMNWSEIEDKTDGSVFKFRQKKTGKIEYLPISDQARELLGERDVSSDQVFTGFKKSAWQDMMMAKWIGLAGIDRTITWHCFRHTYAVLLLENGVGIFTVKEMLGQKDIKSTMVYAKIVNETKKEAANVIKLGL